MTHSLDTTDRAAIVALVAELDAAASALDIDRFLDRYVDGPDFAFVFNGTMRTTLSEARAFHEAAWSNVCAVTFRTKVGHIAFPAPSVATLCAIGNSKRTLITGERRAGAYALMMVLVRRTMGWRVLQCHESTPALPSAPVVCD